jgi:hypothetical protein
MTLRDWLIEKCGCYDVVEVEIEIKGRTWRGCRYKQDRNTPTGSRGMREGTGSYVREAIYLLGPLPPAFVRSRRTVFTIEGEPDEWYVISWVRADVATDPKFADMHFEGNEAFQIGPWRFEGEKIDERERTPYQRVKATLREATAVSG